MEKAQKENEEVDGDDDSDDMETMGKCTNGDDNLNGKQDDVESSDEN